MGVQAMSCPKCGKQASEYAPNKWRCLHCGTNFLYEPPSRPDQYIKVETITSLDESAFFVCAKCQGKFPKMAHPEFVCKSCNKTFCKEHSGSGEFCGDCYAAKRARIGYVLLGIVAIIMLLVWWRLSR
jgi:DNA-directed RNA polymerase subunit RPC12/RpoP